MERISPPSAKKEGPAPLLANNLRWLRQARRISQQELAEAVGLKRSNIASYESGIVEPRPERFLALARFFQIDPALLLTQDLSRHSSFSHPVSPQAGKKNGMEEKSGFDNLFQQLEAKTTDLKKILEGFHLFYDLKRSRNPAPESLQHDLENLLHLLENLLETNQHFFQSMRSPSPPDFLP